MENKIIKHSVKYYFLFLIFSCTGLDYTTKKAVNTGLEPVINATTMVAQILIESVTYIYEKDSIKPDTPIYICQFKVKHETDSLEFKFDSIEAIMTKDSIIHFNKITISDNNIFRNEVVIPHLKFNLVKDSIMLNITFKYLTDKNIQMDNSECKCFTVNYIMFISYKYYLRELKRIDINTVPCLS